MLKVSKSVAGRELCKSCIELGGANDLAKPLHKMFDHTPVQHVQYIRCDCLVNVCVREIKPERLRYVDDSGALECFVELPYQPLLLGRAYCHKGALGSASAPLIAAQKLIAGSHHITALLGMVAKFAVLASVLGTSSTAARASDQALLRIV